MTNKKNSLLKIYTPSLDNEYLELCYNLILETDNQINIEDPIKQFTEFEETQFSKIVGIITQNNSIEYGFNSRLISATKRCVELVPISIEATKICFS